MAKYKNSDKPKVKALGVGMDAQIESIIRDELTKIHQPTKILDLPFYMFKQLKSHTKDWHGTLTNFVTIHGAAGESDIPESKIKVITDHYSSDTRKALNDAPLEDPLLATSTDRRFDSTYEDGFHLEYETAIAFNPTTKTHMTKEQSEEKFVGLKEKFDAILLQLETWKDDIDLLATMRDAASVSFTQGRTACLISPGLEELKQNPGALPYSVEHLHYSELGDPIVDVGLTKQLIGVKLKLEDKKVARADEIIYITRNKRGYRKDGKYLGTAPLESALIISRSIKRIYNYDIPQAIVAAYITKILFSFDDDVEDADATAFIQSFLKTGKLAFGMRGVNKVDVVQPKVDVQMIDTLETKLSDTELSIVGVPKSMLNREHNLNRDIATVEAIQFMKFVRKPDEELLAKHFQIQLFDKLLSILSGIPLNQLPKRIKIVRNKPEKDLDTIFEKQESLSTTKTDEIEGDTLEQSDAVSIFGASGDKGIIVTPKGDGSYGIIRDNSNS